MKLASYARSARRYLVQALVVGLVLGALAAAASIALNRVTYQATATVTMRAVGLAAGDVAGQAAITQLAASAPVLFGSQQVLEPAGRAADPAVFGTTLDKGLVVRSPANSLVFTAALTGLDADRTKALLGGIVSEFSKVVADGALSAGSTGPRLEVAGADIQVQETPGSALGRFSSVAAGLLAGLTFGLLYLLIRVATDDKVWTARDLADVTDDSVVATVPAAAPADALRGLAADLDFLQPAASGRLAFAPVTRSASAAPVVRGLAETLGPDAAAVDLDLAARPLGDGPGVADALAGRPVDFAGVAYAGGPAPNAGDLLAADAVPGLLDRIQGGRRWLLINAAPLLDSSAGALGARTAGAVVPVVDLGATTRSQVRQALAVAEAAGVRVPGVVLVQAAAKK